jgi:hypothetical protein
MNSFTLRLNEASNGYIMKDLLQEQTNEKFSDVVTFRLTHTQFLNSYVEPSSRRNSFLKLEHLTNQHENYLLQTWTVRGLNQFSTVVVSVLQTCSLVWFAVWV